MFRPNKWLIKENERLSEENARLTASSWEDANKAAHAEDDARAYKRLKAGMDKIIKERDELRTLVREQSKADDLYKAVVDAGVIKENTCVDDSFASRRDAYLQSALGMNNGVQNAYFSQMAGLASIGRLQ